MKIIVNGRPREVTNASLEALLGELSVTHKAVATAVNGAFVARDARPGVLLREGDSLEILVPMQGG